MLNDKQVMELYVPIAEYPHINFDASIREAFSLLKKNFEEGKGYRSILVHDGQSRLKGLLSMRDMVRAVGPDFLKKTAPSYKGHQPYQGMKTEFPALSLIWQEGFPEKCKEEAKKPVKEVMTVIEDTVLLNDPIAKCVYLMIVHDIIVMPVVEDGKVVGVVRLVDLFKEITDCVLED
jgi:CBS domain-containing protein